MGLFSRRQQEPQADDRWDSLNAEYQNYRRRTTEELARSAEQSARKTAAVFLPFYDDLQRALSSRCTDPAFYKGVELILKELLHTFRDLGIVPMEVKGQLFNPTRHEAVRHIRDPRYRQAEIVEVVQTGFTMHEEIIRHAKVVVANCQ